MPIAWTWRRAFAALFILSGAFAGLLSWSLGQSKNLLVFRHAAETLLAHGDLYAGGFVDYFKYSPTFALLFVPLASIPAPLAAAIWGAVNFAVAFAGIDAAFERDDRAKRTALAVALAGVLLATDGDQSNLLVAGAMLLAWSSLARGRVVRFALLVALATHVKLFPVVAAGFALLHPRPARSLAAAGAALVLAAAMPLAVLAPRELAAEYVSWGALLAHDHANRGWCAMTMLEDGLGLHASTSFVQIAGAGLLASPLLVGPPAAVGASFKRTFAAAVLVFSVLFNHRAEYATYVVSAIGVGLWFAGAPRSPLRLVLVACAVVAHGPLFTVHDPSLGGPLAFLAAHRVFHPLRVLPLFAIWSLMLFDLLRERLRIEVRDAAAEHP